jgi:hypothetical protein
MNPRQDGGRKKRRIRGAIGRGVMKVPVLRRWQIRRTLKFIDKSRAKGRRLPDELHQMARFLDRVPKAERAKVFEEAMVANQELPNMGRDYRRAAARQRRSGRSDARYRPGAPPGAIKEVRRKSR